MEKYDVKVRYIFEGTYTVVAEDREEAESMVAEDCGLVLGGNIHTTRDDDEVTDWKFGCHPDFQVLSVRQRGGKSPMSVFGDRIEELRKDIIEAIRQLLLRCSDFVFLRFRFSYIRISKRLLSGWNT